MAANQKRRQKQLERKKAKRKERHQALTKQKNRGLAEQLSEAAARAPVLDAYVTEAVWDEGLGYVLLSRELPNGRVAAALFLVDRYCLGVKDAFGRMFSKAEYENEFIARLEEKAELIEVEPATARKLVEDSVEYARRLGLNPHQDYFRAKAIFGDIDPQAADEEFEFGKDGKPLFVAGPFDTPERCYRILSSLEHSCGRGGFDCVLPFLGDMPAGLRERIRVIEPGEDEDEYADHGPEEEEED